MYPLIAVFRQRRLRLFLLPLIVVSALGGVLVVGYLDRDSAVSPALPAGIRPLKRVPPSAERVEVGMYPTTIYGIEEAANTFHADAYIWFKWKGDKDPTETMELINAVDQWSIVRKNINPKPIKMADGRMIQVMHVEGRFFQPFALARYPLDEHHLTILLEDSFYTESQLVYVPDLRNSGLGELLKIPGWRIKGWSIEGMVRSYDTNFGDPSVGAKDSRFAHLRYDLTISRPLSYFGWKLYLPLVISMLLTWSALLIDPEKVEPRTGLPATSLLTAVFLQLGYSQTLPDVGGPVLMDKIYVLAYVLIILVLIEATATARWARDGLKISGVARAYRLDRAMLVFQILAFFGGTALLIVFP
jgi:hypothetical protein